MYMNYEHGMRTMIITNKGSSFTSMFYIDDINNVVKTMGQQRKVGNIQSTFFLPRIYSNPGGTEGLRSI